VRWLEEGGRPPVPERGNDVGRFLDTAYDAVLARRLLGIYVRLLVQPRLIRDQLQRK
jgi:hypothetical protein